MEFADLSSLTRQTVKFFTGIRLEKKTPVIPVFFPFMGCPHRCLFCAQTAQTGQSALSPDAAGARLAAVAPDLARRHSPYEVAFYGGTFTLWPQTLQGACLHVARSNPHCVAARCSTRPDAVEPGDLRRLRRCGLSLIELGVQSFDDAALHAVQRGYTGASALAACGRVREAGCALGVQLMPGMPGVTPEIFLRDVAQALAAGASCLRFYPCLVLAQTPLAELWQQGRYTPWDLETTIRTLGQALALTWAAEVPVIRMGLATSPGLDDAILAGPRHPSLGSLVQAEALAHTVEELTAARRPRTLHLPRQCQGFVGGADSPVRQRLARAGLFSSDVLWHDSDRAMLIFQ